MNILNAVVITIIGIALTVVIYISAAKYTKYDAIDRCIKSAQVVSERENGSKLTEPDKFWYDFCMEEKGLN